jgi:hypothetical protein
MSDEDRQMLLRRQAGLTALSKHPSFPELEAVVDGRVRVIEDMVLAHAFAGGPESTALDQRYLDYWRGYANGMRWIVRAMVAAEASVEHFLQQAKKEE